MKQLGSLLRVGDKEPGDTDLGGENPPEHCTWSKSLLKLPAVNGEDHELLEGNACIAASVG